MTIRAVIFDVYKTLLEVGPPPADAGARWNSLWREGLNAPARVSLAQFNAACEPIISREHAAARRAGVPFPEIFWPAVAAEALPELTRLPATACDDFLLRHAQMVRTLRLMPDAAATLHKLRRTGIALGIASNAQPYTLREVEAALSEERLARDIFTRALCFWSFDHGFSKPDPHVFRLLTARLRAAGISPGEALMVGDRLDNDIEPAHSHGLQTWHLQTEHASATSGDWKQLQEWLATVELLPSAPDLS